MPKSEHIHNLSNYLRAMVASWRDDSRSDAELLAGFAETRDEAAFMAIVGRHGPVVWQTCRRILGDSPDAEDVLQATFLTLARKAGRFPVRNLVGWLYRVSRRGALNAKADSRRRRELAQRLSSLPPKPVHSDADRAELEGALDQELAELPERLRLPLLLRYMQGKTQDEVAKFLGCSRSVARKRLDQAEKTLRQRLERRGMALGGTSAVAFLANHGNASAVPARLLASTVQAAVAFRNGTLTGGLADLAVKMLEHSPASGPWWMKGWLVALFCLGGVGAGIEIIAWRAGLFDSLPGKASTTNPGEVSQQLKIKEKASPNLGDCYGDPLPEHALARLGTIRFRHQVEHCTPFTINFTPDGARVLTAGGDNIPRLWDVASGKLVREFNAVPKAKIVANSYRGVWGAAVSADGRLVAARSGLNGDLFVLELASGKLVHEFPCQKNRTGVDPAVNFAFSPDGKSIAAELDGELQVLDTVAGSQHWTKAANGVVGLAFSPDGLLLASVGRAKGVHLWDAHTGKLCGKLHSSRSAVGVSFSPNGRTLAVEYGIDSNEQKHSVQLWDVVAQKEIRWLGEPSKCSRAFPTFSPAGDMMATSGGGIRLWDPATGKELRCCQRSFFQWGPTAFSPNGRLLAALDGSVLRFWDVTSGEPRPSENLLGHEDDVLSAAFLADGETIVSGGKDHSARIWNARSGQMRQQQTNARDAVHHSLLRGIDSHAAASRDGKTLAAAFLEGRVGMDHALDAPDAFSEGLFTRIQLWNSLGESEGPGWKVRGSPNGLVFSPNGKHLAASVWAPGPHTEPEVYLWRTAEGGRQEQKVSGGHPVFSPDGRILATIQGDKKDAVALWDVATGKKLTYVNTGECIMSLAVSPDGRHLATGSDRVALHPVYWCGAIDQVHVSSPRNVDFAANWAVLALAFSPDGRLLASSGSDQIIHVWEVATGKERSQFSGHAGSVLTLNFSSEGRRLVSGGCDTTLLVWDVTGGAADKEATQPSKKKLDDLWRQLADDGALEAGRAVWELTAAGLPTVSMLQKRLRPAVSKVSPEVVAKLIADLDSRDFPVRRKAQETLSKLEEWCEPALQDALAKRTSAEMRHTLHKLLMAVETSRRLPSPAKLRLGRAVEVLEHIGTTEARRVLRNLVAEGSPKAGFTQDAQAALDRLEDASRRHNRRSSPAAESGAKTRVGVGASESH